MDIKSQKRLLLRNLHVKKIVKEVLEYDKI